MSNRYWLSVMTQTVYEMSGDWEPTNGNWVEVTVIEFFAALKAKREG